MHTEMPPYLLRNLSFKILFALIKFRNFPHLAYVAVRTESMALRQVQFSHLL